MNRRKFAKSALAGIATITASGTANRMDGQTMQTSTSSGTNAFNQLLKDPAQTKMIFDVSQIANGRFLVSIKNALNGLHSGFGLPAEQIRVIAGLHGPANMLNYDDYIWSKYRVGEWLSTLSASTGEKSTKNPFFETHPATPEHHDADSSAPPIVADQQTGILALQNRGVRFLSCHNSAVNQAQALIVHLNLSLPSSDMVKEMEAHTLPGVLIVPSMVAAMGLLQSSGHYAYIKV